MKQKFGVLIVMLAMFSVGSGCSLSVRKGSGGGPTPVEVSSSEDLARFKDQVIGATENQVDGVVGDINSTTL